MIAWLNFASLAMLGWAAAALIPVILHLLRRRKKDRIPWAAMQLLRQVVQQESRRVNIQQLLLLLLRVSILLLLSVTLARPFLIQSLGVADASNGRPSKLWIIALDTSYSMGYRANELTRLERARQRVARLVGESQAGDAFALIALDQPARAIIGRPTFDTAALLREVQELSDNARGCDPVSTLALAAQIATDARNDPIVPTDVEVVLLTDLGVDAWQTAETGAVQSNLKRLGQLANVTFEPILDSRPINVAVEAVRLSQNQPIVGRPFTVEVTLASYGQAASLPLQLEWDGQIVNNSLVDIGNQQRNSLSLTVTPRKPGIALLSVVLPPDGLSIDNRYDLAVEVRKGYSVLIVEPRLSAASAWKFAIQPEPADSWLGLDAEVRVVSELQWQSMNDRQWDAMIMNDPPLASVHQIARLTNYVQNGGILIVGLGRKLSTSAAGERKRAELLDHARQGLLGYKILQPSEVSEWPVDPLSYTSPIVKMFEGFPNSGLLTTPLFRYWRIEPQDTSLTVDLATIGGEPLLVHRRLGKGSIASFLSAPEDGRDVERGTSWNAMTTWPSFLPLAQQTLQILLNADLPDFNVLAGQPLSGSLASLTDKQSVTLIRPDQTEIQIAAQPSQADSGSTWSYESTDHRGVYRVVEPESSRQIFTVNIDPAQCSLASIDSPIVQPMRRVATQETIGSSELPTSAADWIARSLLVCLGLLLITESLAAWMLGRRIG